MKNYKNHSEMIIERNVYCPYCESQEAILIGKTVSTKSSLQFPIYGLKFGLSLLYLHFYAVWKYGYKLLEMVRVINSVTYVFCPKCGNSYTMNPVGSVEEITEAEPFYRYEEGKKIMGICKGISEYTGISLLWVRIMTVIYGLTIVGAIFYFLIALVVPIKENVISEE